MKKSHIGHLLILSIILGVGVITFFSAQGDKTMQIVVGLVTTAAYVCWGIIHHALQQDLHPKVVVEYLLIAAVAIVLLMTVLGT